MWLASEMAAFAQVAEFGSFTAAARALGVPKVAVSRAVASLERRLGTRLLTRTTRRVALTPAGTLLQPHCQRLLREVDAVRTGFTRTEGGAPRLRLRVDAGYGRVLVSPLVPRFLEHFPDLELQVAMQGALPTAAATDWDLLIGAGEPPTDTPGSMARSSTLLASLSQLLWATPAYLQRTGRPKRPAELGGHPLLQAQLAADATASLRLRSAQELRTIPARTALRVSDPALVHSCTAAGIGIGVLPEFLCRQGEAQGRLERVLPGWSVEPQLQLRAFHDEGAEAALPIRQFLEFLLANLVPVLGATA